MHLLHKTSTTTEAKDLGSPYGLVRLTTMWLLSYLFGACHTCYFHVISTNCRFMYWGLHINEGLLGTSDVPISEVVVGSLSICISHCRGFKKKTTNMIDGHFTLYHIHWVIAFCYEEAQPAIEKQSYIQQLVMNWRNPEPIEWTEALQSRYRNHFIGHRHAFTGEFYTPFV